MKSKAKRLGSLLALCLTLGFTLVSLPVWAQDDGGIIEICEGNDKIQFHNKGSGFKLEAQCQGKIRWTVTLIGDIVIDDFTFLTLALESEDGTIMDASIAISADDALEKRELNLVTKNKDKISVTFKVDKGKTQ